MSFVSPIFLFAFLPIVTVTCALFSFNLGIVNALLICFSLIFYVWGAGENIFLLLISLLLNYLLAGILSFKFSNKLGNQYFRVSVLIAAVILNIGGLVYYKYAGFLLEQIPFINKISWLAGLEHGKNAALPIGISFVAFHALSYFLDIYRGKTLALSNPFKFLLYMTFFPQLLSGPITRLEQIYEQLEQRQFFDWANFRAGLVRFSYGLSKKVMIADNISEVVAFSFNNLDYISTLDAWLGIVAYTIQIYFDFSGYSDMAIGLAKMFGFNFPENFNHPYSAVSITDFWRRWHMSLSLWFRDYVYIPLGGSRVSTIRKYLNILIVFILTGMWHGAKWTFILWGLYYAIILIIEKIYADTLGKDKESNANQIIPRLLTLVIVMIGWVLFRAPSITFTTQYYAKMLDFHGIYFSEGMLGILNFRSILALVVGSITFIMPRSQCIGIILEYPTLNWQSLLTGVIMIICLPISLAMVLASSSSPFLYFQF